MKEMTLEDIKKTSIGILDFIDKVCHDNDLTYYLCGGTLLGAVRHRGFIPWDDDIDIMMPRSDYERLFLVWPENDKYAVLNHNNTHNFPYAYGKAIDLSTIKIEPVRYLAQQHLGVDVDIFPIDELPKDDGEASTYFEHINKMQKRLELQLALYGKGSTFLRTLVKNLRLSILRLSELLGLTSISRITKRFDILAQQYTGQNTGFCGITAISHYGLKEKNPIINYDKTVLVPFEGKEYPAPIGYNEYLSRLYGTDYIQLPPEEKRLTHHHYEAYWK